MITRSRAWFQTPVGRGFVLMVIASWAFGFALAAQGNIVANFFEEELHLAGPQFGYITAIREIPGFLLIFLTALFYRMSLPRLTAGALVLLAIGFTFFGFSWSFWSVAPWVVISSMGYHTFLQTQNALGMTLTTEARSGRILGQIAAISNSGGLFAMVVVLIVFHYGWLDFRSTFILCGVMALIAALAIAGFPHLRDGELQTASVQREPIVLRREYRYYYLLSVLDGARQQIFFSFGLWVLVDHFNLSVPVISAILIGVTTLSMTTGTWIGQLIDRHGERQILALVNIGYVFALAGYGLIDNVVIAVICYIVYSFIFPLSAIGATIYLRKVAVADEIAPSLAMGLTLQHISAIVIPIATGFVLNYVGYQIPFLVACVFSLMTFAVTRRLSPETQKSPRRLAEERSMERRETASATSG